MSEWPEPTREPGETPRWLGWTVAALVFGALLWAVRDDNGVSFDGWRMPELAMPQIELPEIQWPDFAENESNAPSQGQPQPAPEGMADASAVPEAVAVVRGPNMPESSAPAFEGLPLEQCLAMLNEAANAVGPGMLIEDSDVQRVVRFKTLQGDLTMTCSRVDGTLRVEQG